MALYKVGDRVLISENLREGLKKSYGNLDFRAEYKIKNVVLIDGKHGYYIELPAKHTKEFGDVKYDCFVWEDDISIARTKVA